MKPGNLAQLTISMVLFALIFSPAAASATKSSPTPAQPHTTFTVNANTDMVDATPGDGVCETASGNGMCTLRAAIMEANAHAGEDIIDLPVANFLLTIPGVDEDQGATGDLDITDSLRIIGTYYENTIIDAQGLDDRVFDITGTGVAVNISRVKIQNGSITGDGGAIRARADLTLQDLYLENNQSSKFGGAIYSSDQLTLINGTIHGSSAANNGGAINTSSALTAKGTKYSHNSTDEEGGAIYAMQSAHVHTVSARFFTHDTIFIRNTILSGNHDRRLLNLVADDCYGTLTSGDYNLVGTLSNCSLVAATEHNLIGADPLLDELADNGGKTHTHALLEGSPAVDAANPAGCLGKDDVLLTSDQRGVARSLDGDGDGISRCDIGAYELSIYKFVYLPLTIKTGP